MKDQPLSTAVIHSFFHMLYESLFILKTILVDIQCPPLQMRKIKPRKETAFCLGPHSHLLVESESGVWEPRVPWTPRVHASP